jgi:hypothetical protein
MAELISGKTPKECYQRAKILKLIKHGAAAARVISQQLFAEKAGDIFKAKVACALKQYLQAKIKQGTIQTTKLDPQFRLLDRVKS